MEQLAGVLEESEQTAEVVAGRAVVGRVSSKPGQPQTPRGGVGITPGGRGRKGVPEKIAIALRLREETNATQVWIAERLQMGTRTHT